jgi:hypothetical protein
MRFRLPPSNTEDAMNPTPPEASRHEDRADPYPDPLPTEKLPQAASQTPPPLKDSDLLRALVETAWFLPAVLLLSVSVMTLGLVLGMKIADAKHRTHMLHSSPIQTP